MSLCVCEMFLKLFLWTWVKVMMEGGLSGSSALVMLSGNNQTKLYIYIPRYLHKPLASMKTKIDPLPSTAVPCMLTTTRSLPALELLYVLRGRDALMLIQPFNWGESHFLIRLYFFILRSEPN